MTARLGRLNSRWPREGVSFPQYQLMVRRQRFTRVRPCAFGWRCCTEKPRVSSPSPTWDSAGVFRCNGHVYSDHKLAAAAIDQIELLHPRGIYVRSTSMKAAPLSGRGGADLSLELPMLWSDLDFGTIGHAPQAPGVLPLPPDEEAARQIVSSSALPKPSWWLHSGGGLYGVWLFDKPHLISDDLDQVTALSAGVQKILAAAAHELGYSYGTGVGDLARVLRVPGTVNRKAGLERPCRVLHDDDDRVYSYAELTETVKSALPAPAMPIRSFIAAPEKAREHRDVDVSRELSEPRTGPFDVLATSPALS